MKDESAKLKKVSKEKTIRFPIIRITYDSYRCPCGKDGIRMYKHYYTGLDDADPDWGGYDEEYAFDLDDPCYKKYCIDKIDWLAKEWILTTKDIQ